MFTEPRSEINQPVVQSRQVLQRRSKSVSESEGSDFVTNRLTDRLLLEVASKVLQSSTLELLTWHLTRLHGLLNLSVSNGIFRISGTVRQTEQVREWSVVLKILARPADRGRKPGDWTYWKREALAYKTGLLGSWSDGIVTPRCYKVEELPEKQQVWLWLEDIHDIAVSDWTLERYRKVACALGTFNGTYLASHRPLPDYPWLSRRKSLTWVNTLYSSIDAGYGGTSLRSWVINRTVRPVLKRVAPKILARGVEVLIGRSLTLLNDEAIWEQPLVRSAFPEPLTERVYRLWDNHRKLVEALERLPRSLCHLDVWNPNIFEVVGIDGQPKTLLLDWEYTGYGAIGEELVQLIWCNLLYFELELEQMQQVEQVIFEGYLEGLRQAGWQGDPRLVRLGYAASAVLRWGVSVPGLALALNPVQHAREEQRWGRPIESIVRRRAAAAYRLLDLADEAFALLEADLLPG
ncbi:MAG TPA: phosphotransferase [Chloroflexia bacterium]|nr:phosphotransferase [Chloroflexia bacterium]